MQVALYSWLLNYERKNELSVAHEQLQNISYKFINRIKNTLYSFRRQYNVSLAHCDFSESIVKFGWKPCMLLKKKTCQVLFLSFQTNVYSFMNICIFLRKCIQTMHIARKKICTSYRLILVFYDTGWSQILLFFISFIVSPLYYSWD